METIQPPPQLQKKISNRILFITHFSSFFTGASIMYLFQKYFPYSF